jgi:hypothetical protein
MSKEVIVNIDDIKKAVYFISNLTQMQENRPMRGALNSKGDYMGGIFDRWINIIPESVAFNKIILPKIAGKKDVKVITDYYDYDPKQVGIAPDVIGISVNKKAIPFVKFDERWIPVDGKPQIEVKTFKKNQKMVSLRNQGYDNKYLVLAETNFRIDYLVPLIKEEIYSDDIYDELYMNDDIFIISNELQMIAQSRKINVERKDIGTISLLGITTANEFMNISTKCDAGVSVEYFSEIEENQNKRSITCSVGMLKEYCTITENGLYKMNNKWYEKIDLDGMTYKYNKKIKTLDFFVSDIESIEILKICKSKMIIKVHKDCIWEDTNLEAGKIYNIIIKDLDRSGAKGEEYFLLKTSIQKLKNKEDKLLSELKQIIDNN